MYATFISLWATSVRVVHSGVDWIDWRPRFERDMQRGDIENQVKMMTSDAGDTMTDMIVL